jgi:hypothetical protein
MMEDKRIRGEIALLGLSQPVASMGMSRAKYIIRRKEKQKWGCDESILQLIINVRKEK